MTPLFKKLNLGDHETILVLNQPETFETEISGLAGVTILRNASPKPIAQFAIGFAITQAQLDALSRQLSQSTAGDAIVWVAYPKATSKRFQCEFNRDNGWTVLGDAGFEPVRQIAIDEDWSALRFRRTEYIKSLSRREEMAISAAGKRRARH